MTTEEMLEQKELKERLERVVNLFSYKYAKANTKSKKDLMANDLILLSKMCKDYFPMFKFDLPWDKDDDLYKKSNITCYKFIDNIIINRNKYYQIFISTMRTILKADINLYKYYGKEYKKYSVKELEDIFCSFLNSLEPKIYDEYKKNDE